MNYKVGRQTASVPSIQPPAMSSNLPYGSSYNSGIGTTNRPTVAAPQPPPRNQNYQSGSYANYLSNPYHTTGSIGSYPSYYNMPLYNSYSPYMSRPSYNTYLTPGNPSSFESSPGFIREAHESSREAFASIESIVSAFSSINMMIESTYHALHSSFNAVLAVAENMSKVKLQFGQVLSMFSFIRSLQWLYKKLLYLLGIRKFDPATESAWNSASKSVENPLNSKEKKSSWPVLMFLFAVYAGPFLMWKFISSFMMQEKPEDSWENKNEDCYYAYTKYKYDARRPEELSFSVGEYLKLAPMEKQRNKSWPLASNGKRTGLIPINFVDVKFRSAQSNNTVAPGIFISPSLSKPSDKNYGATQTSLLSEKEVTENHKVWNALPPKTTESLVHEVSKPTKQLVASLSNNEGTGLTSMPIEASRFPSINEVPKAFSNKNKSLGELPSKNEAPTELSSKNDVPTEYTRKNDVATYGIYRTSKNEAPTELSSKNDVPTVFASKNEAPTELSSKNDIPTELSRKNEAPAELLSKNELGTDFPNINNTPTEFAGKNEEPTEFSSKNKASTEIPCKNEASTEFSSYNDVP